MKKLLALLLAVMLVIPAAMADYPDKCSLTIPYEGSPTGSLTLEWYDPPSGAISSSETFVNGLYIEERWMEAYDLNLLLAEAGDTTAMVHLGDQHLNGLGVPEDAAAAFSWYQRAAEKGNSNAQFRIALMYLNGWGVEADAIYAVGLLAECTTVSSHSIACLYLLGHGNLAPDMDKAMYWFDDSVPHELHMAQSDSANASYYQELYEQKREAFLATDTLPKVLTGRPGPTLWADDVHASDAMDMGTFWRNGDGGVVDHSEAARWFEMAIDLDDNSSFVSEWSHYALGDYYHNGTLGVFDTDKAIRHYTYGAYYDEVAEMFLGGVTGPDGTVYLAPNAILADAFAAIDEYRDETDTHFALIGDLFRTGQDPDGTTTVTPDPNLAALFYFMGYNAPYSASHLTEMYKADLITDPMLLYRMGTDIPYSECDMSELILLLADDLIHGRVTVWKPNADFTQTYLARKLLQRALEMDKLPDPQAAYDLLALIPSDE